MSPGRNTWLRAARAGVVCLGVLLAGGLSGAEAVTPAEQEVRTIISRWLEALGGAQKIAGLTTVDYSCTIDFGAGPPIETNVRADIRGGYRYDYELPRFGRLTQAFDGRQTWQRNAELGFGYLSAQDHAMNLTALDLRAPVNALRLFPDHQRLPDETIAGQALQVLEMANASGARGKWFFDPATGLRVRVEAETPNGRLVVESADFRPVPGSGLLEPFTVKRTFGGRTTKITLHSIIHNAETDPQIFAPSSAALDDSRQIERILTLHGQLIGREALRQVQSRVTRQLVEVTTSGMKIPTKISQKRPGLLLIEQETPGMGSSLQGFDGRVGWAWSELQGYRTLQGAELQQLLGIADLEGPLHLSEQCPLRRLLEEKEDNGRRIVGIALASLAGHVGVAYFDVGTYDLVRLETYLQAGPDGQLKVTAEFSDFRQVDGVRLPFRTTLDNPAMRIITTIESVQQNVPLDDKLFQPRKDE